MNDIRLFKSQSIVNLVIKTAGNACNIDCEYCFEKKKIVSSHCMTKSVFGMLIRSVTNQCTIVFHGGEPLLIGKENFRKLLEIIRPYYPDKVIAVRIQTNGTLLDQEYSALFFDTFSDLNIEIAISVDGMESMNRLRVDGAGRSTFSRVMDAFSRVEEYGQKVGLLSVISRDSLKMATQYVEVLSTIPNLMFVKMNPLFNLRNNQLSRDSITPMEYAKFVYEVFNAYIAMQLYRSIPIEPILSMLQRINHRKSRYCNYSSRKCFYHLSVYPDGRLGPCDCLSINDFPLGDIQSVGDGGLDSFLHLLDWRQPTRLLQNLIDSCVDCDIRYFCMGGCLSQRFYFRRNEELSADFCASKHYLERKLRMFAVQSQTDGKI